LLVLRELKNNMLESSSLALGFFDGVHLGHQKVILNAVNKAKALGISSAAVTFSKHPRAVISKSKMQMISSLDDRLEMLEKLGLDAAVVIDFNESIAKMTAKDYLENILINCLNAKNITIGYNHKFGSQSSKAKPNGEYINLSDNHDICQHGNGKFLEDHSLNYDYKVDIISPVKVNNHIVSSSAIRKQISNGDVENAGKFLGRPFSVKGVVVEGKHIGKTIGFPTANLDISDILIIPAGGVYSGLAQIKEEIYKSVINVGKRPTLGDLKKDIIEAHLLDFNEDIYGSQIKISFLNRIRNEQKFGSLDELKNQIGTDCEKVRLLQKTVRIK